MLVNLLSMCYHTYKRRQETTDHKEFPYARVCWNTVIHALACGNTMSGEQAYLQG